MPVTKPKIFTVMKFLLSILVGVTAWLGAAAPAAAEVTVGQPFPDIADFHLTPTLPIQQDRVVLVDFWATWCAPCQWSFPAYNSLQKEFGAQGLTIIGVSVDRDEETYNQFVEKHHPTFTTLIDIEQHLAAAVHPSAMPTCYLIDRHGVVRDIFTGFHGAATTARLREEIIKLLGDKS